VTAPQLHCNDLEEKMVDCLLYTVFNDNVLVVNALETITYLARRPIERWNTHRGTRGSMVSAKPLISNQQKETLSSRMKEEGNQIYCTVNVVLNLKYKSLSLKHIHSCF